MEAQASGFKKFIGTRAGKWAFAASIIFALALIGSLAGKKESTQPSVTNTPGVVNTENTNTSIETVTQPVNQNVNIEPAPQPVPQPVNQNTNTKPATQPAKNTNTAPITNTNKNAPGFSCSITKTCDDMSSCDEAYFYLNTCGKSGLDRDKDGVPCESVCK